MATLTQTNHNLSARFAPIEHIKIQRDDWSRMPAWFKSQADGIPRVLSKINGIPQFIPVQILN